MGKKSAPPPPPDYTQAAEKTAQSSQDAQTRADWANRPDQVTPWGTQSWQSSAMVDPATGKPVTKWTQNTVLSGQQQQALDDQMAIQAGKSDIAGGMMGRLQASYDQPFDPSQLTQMGQGGRLGGPTRTAGMMGAGLGIQGQVGGTGLDSRMRLEDAMMERMRPQHQQQQGDLETQLQNQGLTRGSEAWNREMQRMGDQQSRERFNAMDRGLAEQQGQFGMNTAAGQFANQAQAQRFGQRTGQQAQDFGQQMSLQGQNFGQQMQQSEYQNRIRQQQIAEQLQQRAIPLNELNALLTGSQVAMPSMPGFNTSQSAGGTNYSGAASSQYSAGMDAYNAKQQQQQSTMSGIGQIAGMAGMMMMSDIRLKTNIVRVGDHSRGIGIYEYDIQGKRERGVIAQEVQAVAPHLVRVHKSGYLMVNYGGL